MNNYFELLQLPAQYELDLDLLEQHYRQVQANIHPDRFVNKSDVEKRVAVQYSALLNDAYQTLKSPLKRAVYLLKSHGIDVNLERETLKDEAFLMEQMNFYERIDAGEDIKPEMQARAKALQEELLRAFAEKNYLRAKVLVQQLRFFML